MSYVDYIWASLSSSWFSQRRVLVRLLETIALCSSGKKSMSPKGHEPSGECGAETQGTLQMEVLREPQGAGKGKAVCLASSCPKWDQPCREWDMLGMALESCIPNSQSFST